MKMENGDEEFIQKVSWVRKFSKNIGIKFVKNKIIWFCHVSFRALASCCWRKLFADESLWKAKVILFHRSFSADESFGGEVLHSRKFACDHFFALAIFSSEKSLCRTVGLVFTVEVLAGRQSFLSVILFGHNFFTHEKSARNKKTIWFRRKFFPADEKFLLNWILSQILYLFASFPADEKLLSIASSWRIIELLCRGSSSPSVNYFHSRKFCHE